MWVTYEVYCQIRKHTGFFEKEVLGSITDLTNVPITRFSNFTIGVSYNSDTDNRTFVLKAPKHLLITNVDGPSTFKDIVQEPKATEFVETEAAMDVPEDPKEIVKDDKSDGRDRKENIKDEKETIQKGSDNEENILCPHDITMGSDGGSGSGDFSAKVARQWDKVKEFPIPMSISFLLHPPEESQMNDVDEVIQRIQGAVYRHDINIAFNLDLEFQVGTVLVYF